MEQKCKICGNETNRYYSYYVEGKHNFIYLVCQSCYEKRMSSIDRKSTRLNSSHPTTSRMPSSA